MWDQQAAPHPALDLFVKATPELDPVSSEEALQALVDSGFDAAAQEQLWELGEAEGVACEAVPPDAAAALVGLRAPSCLFHPRALSEHHTTQQGLSAHYATLRAEAEAAAGAGARLRTVRPAVALRARQPGSAEAAAFAAAAEEWLRGTPQEPLPPEVQQQRQKQMDDWVQGLVRAAAGCWVLGAGGGAAPAPAAPLPTAPPIPPLPRPPAGGRRRRHH